MRILRFIKERKHYSQSGFTLMELLVVTGLSGIVAATIGGAIIAQKNLYKQEVRRTKMNQDFRSIFDIIGPQVKLVGERLPSYFPAMLLEDGTNSSSDTLYLRRNMGDFILNLSDEIGTFGTESKQVVFFSAGEGLPAPFPGLDFMNNLESQDAWNEYKLDVWGADDGIAYMYNEQNDNGEFFDFSMLSVVDNAGTNQRAIHAVSGTQWENSYNEDNGQIYLLSEWKLSVVNNYLRLVDSGDDNNYLNLAAEISDFQVRIHMQDGSVSDSFTAADNWQDIENIEITVESTNSVTGVSREWRSKFFPRNVISSLEEG